MSIESDYINKIEEIKQNKESLTAWEAKFVFGDEDSSPIDTRPSLSISQKNVIDRIYDQRIKGIKQEAVTEVKFDSDRIIGKKIDSGSFSIELDGKRIGPNVSQREAVAIVGWMSEVVDDIVKTKDLPF